VFPLRNLKRYVAKAIRQPGYAAKVFSKRLKAQMYYYLGNGRSSAPEAVTLFLTHRCNLRCKMCGQWGESGVTKDLGADAIRQEFSLEQMTALVDDLARFRPSVTLFGGEPLLYPHCLDLIRHIKAKGMHCLMITNGAMLDKYAQDLVEAGLDELNVSLDGGKDLHDEIRGLPGLFERIENGLQAVQSAKKEQGKKKPLINLQCTITKYNMVALEQLTSVAQDLGADSLTYHNLIFLGRELIDAQKQYDKQLDCSSHEWEGFVFSPELDPVKLFEKIEEIRSKTYPFALDMYPNLTAEGLKDYYNNPNYLPKGYTARCQSPWVVAYIFPDGEVKPCLNSSFSFGNIGQEKFSSVWNSAQAVKYRRTLKKESIFPVCVRCTELYRY